MRYSDQIKATWGILPSDALLDRPLFLGSSKFGLYTKGVSNSTYFAENETYNRNPYNGAVGTRAGSTHGYGKDSCLIRSHLLSMDFYLLLLLLFLMLIIALVFANICLVLK